MYMQFFSLIGLLPTSRGILEEVRLFKHIRDIERESYERLKLA